MDPANTDSSSPVPPPPPPAFMTPPPPPPPAPTVTPEPASPTGKKITKKSALILASLLVLVIGTAAGVGLVLTRQKPQVGATNCDDNQRWADISADWTGDNTAQVRNSSTSCTYSVGLASYDFYSWSDQVLRDQDIQQVAPGQTANFEVSIPNCKAQLDLFFGTAALPANHTFPDYANKGLIKWKQVGQTNCVPNNPTATPIPSIRPSNTPIPSVRPSNTPVPSPTPTTPPGQPTNTPQPTATNTPVPSPTPTTPPGQPTNTPGPTSTPVPGPTNTPGPGPTATNTPNNPTATPVTQLAQSGSTTQTWITVLGGFAILGFGLLLAL